MTIAVIRWSLLLHWITEECQSVYQYTAVTNESYMDLFYLPLFTPCQWIPAYLAQIYKSTWRHLYQILSNTGGATVSGQHHLQHFMSGLSEQQRSPDCYFHPSGILPAHWPAPIPAACHLCSVTTHTTPHTNHVKPGHITVVTWPKTDRENISISCSSVHVESVPARVDRCVCCWICVCEV